LGCTLQIVDTGQISGAWFSYGAGGQVTDKKEYDYGLINSASACQQAQNFPSNVSAPPSGITPTRETITAYQSFAATPIFPSVASIFDRPCQQIVHDGSGN